MRLLIVRFLLQSALFSFALTAISQSQTAPNLSPLRNESKENAVAAVFTKLASSDGRSLTRIPYRQELQQLVCSAAVTNKPPEYSPGVPALAGKWHTWSALYRTDQPEQLNPELEKLATQTGAARFAVAVWEVPAADKTEYWVGVQLYASATKEFFGTYFTDNWMHRDDWKRAVAPECSST